MGSRNKCLRIVSFACGRSWPSWCYCILTLYSLSPFPIVRLSVAECTPVEEARTAETVIKNMVEET
jgi:hypothetical protein